MKSIIKILTLLILSLLLTMTVVKPDSAAAQTPPVLAFYYAWFDMETWSSGQSVDRPAELYISANRATIERHVSEAQGAGINAFVQAWYGPQGVNNQTEPNFKILLDVAQARNFQAMLSFELTSPFWGDIGEVTNALKVLLSTHAQHPAYWRYQGKPVIFFWRQQRFSVAEWASIRNQVDPNHNSFWIAEGVDISYQAVFDGHYLYSIAWADSPAGQLAKWGGRVRAYEAKNQVDRLWVATVMPGYDDTRLPRADAFAVSRRNGDYYREVWQGAVDSNPDMIIITSFNEWPEGTHIEPSTDYGNLYLDITRELISASGSRPLAVPAMAVVAQESPPEKPPAQEPPPDSPYIKIDVLTNVRSKPDISSPQVGQLGAGSLIPVVGKTKAGDWWLIDFETAPEGKGWVSAEVVEFVGNAENVPWVSVSPSDTSVESLPIITAPVGGVNLRSGPGLQFELLGRLAEGDTASVVAQDETGGWWQIEHQAGENGLVWVTEALVDFNGDRKTVPVSFLAASGNEIVAVTPTPPEPEIDGIVKITDPINVRSEPSLDGILVGGMYMGESADVLAISQDKEWWQIKFADGVDGKGWVSVEFVEFKGDEGTIPIFGLGFPTPTAAPTATPTATPPQPSPTPIQFPTEFAPTATSVYKATADSIITSRGTPDPSLTELPGDWQPYFYWSDIPWGILSIIVIAGFLFYQFSRKKQAS